MGFFRSPFFWALVSMFGLVGACSMVGSKKVGLILITIEEESLERELGQTYLDYKKRIRGRIIPGLPT